MKQGGLAFGMGLVIATLSASALGAGGDARFAAAGGAWPYGSPIGDSGPQGFQIEFVGRATFYLGFPIKNISDQPLTLTSAATPEPVGSLVTQVKAEFAPRADYSHWCADVPGPCPAPPGFDPRTAKPGPLTVASGHFAVVKVDYRVVSCKAALGASTATGNRLFIRYTAPDGETHQQSFLLKYFSGKLLPVAPRAADCRSSTR
jgi:hypothetical protein